MAADFDRHRTAICLDDARVPDVDEMSDDERKRGESSLADGDVPRFGGGRYLRVSGFFFVLSSHQSRNRTPSGRIIGSRLVPLLSPLTIQDRSKDHLISERNTYSLRPRALAHLSELSVSNRLVIRSIAGDFWTARSFRAIPVDRRTRRI